MLLSSVSGSSKEWAMRSELLITYERRGVPADRGESRGG